MEKPSALPCLLLLFAATVSARAQTVVNRGVFVEGNKKIPVTLMKSPAHDRLIIKYQTRLRVNTDGSPRSYHPDDLTGSTMALNSILNAIEVSRTDRSTALKATEKLAAIKAWRENHWQRVSPYQFFFQNVIASIRVPGNPSPVPRVFTSGPNKGFFVSLTSLKNDVPGGDSGPNVAENQVDCAQVPGLVLPGGKNVLREFGAKVGDILVAKNPANGVIVCAVINDVGPAGVLGEGSVALNSRLLKVNQIPTTYRQAITLDTGNQQITIAIFPGSGKYHPKRPFTAENVAERVKKLVAESGFASLDELVARFLP